MPLLLEKEVLCDIVCEKLNLPKTAPNLDKWTKMVEKIKNANKEVKIALVGKYVQLHDAYLSVEESIFHAASALDAKAEILWIDSEQLTDKNVKETLKGANGVIIPGGFGVRGIEGMICAAKYARENNNHHLHTQTNAKQWDIVFSSVFSGANHTFNASHTKSTRNDNAIRTF